MAVTQMPADLDAHPPPAHRARADVPTVPVVQRAFALSNGNAKELRHHAAVLLAENDPLGHSLGHKAADAAKRRMLRGEA